jgi:hypothetical protein
MELHREKQKKVLESSVQPKSKQKRFRIVKLEERIAPKRGGKGTNNCYPSARGPCNSLAVCVW